VQWNDPTLSIQGLNWDFHTTGAWRVIDSHSVLYACWDDRANQKIFDLVHREIIGVEVQSTMLRVDPVLVFSHGQKLEIFSTDTFEPWVMHLPSGEVFVASPSDQAAFTE
jgi:hypothetical protein